MTIRIVFPFALCLLASSVAASYGNDAATSSPAIGDVAANQPQSPARPRPPRRNGATASATVQSPPPAPPASIAQRAFDGFRAKAPAPDIEKRARAAAAQGRAALTREQAAMAVRLGQAIGLAPPDISAIAHQPVGADPASPAPSAVVRFTPLLFVSSSMPVATLRAYAAQLERTGGALAFRGMPGGLRRVAPFAELSAKILRIDAGCEGPACAMRNVQLVVDPIAFRQHWITRVPALAMVPGDPSQAYCERDESAPPHAGPIVYGDAALSGLLDEVARLGGDKEVRDVRARLDRR